MAVGVATPASIPKMQQIRNTATIFQWNAGGLQSRLPDFRRFVDKHRFPVIAISESRLSQDVRLSGYTVLRSETGLPSTRVLLALRSDLTMIHHNVTPSAVNEYVAATVQIGGLSFTVIAAYIPPRKALDSDRLESILRATPPPHILTGDFNAHHPSWGSRKTTIKAQHLLDIAYQHGMAVLNTGEPTFFRKGVSSALDITVVSSVLLSRISWSVDIESHGSDHLPTYITLDGVPRGHLKHQVRFSNWDVFATAVQESIGSVLSYDDFVSTMARARKASTKTFILPKSYNVADAEFERLRAIRRRAERRARKTLAPEDIRASRRVQKRIQRHMRKLAKREWTSFCSKLDPRKPLTRIWSLVRSLRTPPTCLHPFNSISLRHKLTNLDVAEMFCTKIAAASTSPPLLTLPDIGRASDKKRFIDDPFTMSELAMALSSVNKSSSPGSDGITYTALAHLGVAGKRFLLDIFNQSWMTGRLQPTWKTARIVPILKPGKDPTDLQSYRPIALLSCVGKLMEKMVLLRLDWDLTTRNVYPPQMSGFRKGRSSIDNVIALVNCVQCEKAQRNTVIAVFLDVKAAYDSVTHDAIRFQMNLLGIGGRMYNWLSNYLSDRTIFMTTSDGDTQKHSVTRGVPQGGVLSPALFNISLIGIEKCLPRPVAISLYADDICIWCSGRNRRVLRARLQRGIDSISAFLAARGLEISATKSAAIAFTKRDLTRYELTVMGIPIPYVANHKFLGVTFDRLLTWTPHIRSLKEKFSSFFNIFRMLSSNSGGCTVYSLLRLYDALCEGLLRYSLPALFPLSAGNLKALESMQARILRVCIGVPKTTSTVGTIIECRRLMPIALRKQELLRVRLRFVTRQLNHPLAETCAPDLEDLLPEQHQAPSVPSKPLWLLPPISIHTTVPGIRRRADFPAPALKFFTLQLLHSKYACHTHIYTDGSVTECSSAIAVYIPASRTTITKKLSHRTSSTATELAALRAALRYITTQPASQWAIFTDSRAALQCLQSFPNQQLHWDIRLLHDQAVSAHHLVDLQWIPSHCGVSGNSTADAQASQAHNHEVPIAAVPFSRTDAAALASRVARQVQLSVWSAPLRRYAPLYSIDPDCTFKLPPGLTKHDAAVIHRVRLNVAYTRQFRYKLQQTSSPLCEDCHCPEDIHHVICVCPRYDTPRLSLTVTLGKLPTSRLTLHDVLGPWSCAQMASHATKAFLCFLRSSGLVNTL